MFVLSFADLMGLASFSFAVYRLAVLVRARRGSGQPIDRIALASSLLVVARDAHPAFEAVLAMVEKLLLQL